MSWEVTVIDQGFEIIFATHDATTAEQAKREARDFFGLDVKIVKAVRVPS